MPVGGVQTALLGGGPWSVRWWRRLQWVLSAWARKHYHYPDLPHGFQVTQLDAPLGGSGFFLAAVFCRYC